MIATDLDAGKLKALKNRQGFALDVAFDADKVEALAKKVIGIRRAEYSGQLRRLCASGLGARLFGRRLGFVFRPQRQIDAPHLARLLPAMLKNGGGSIVNISSAVSSIRGVPARYAYGATKAAVIGLTKAVAADFIAQGHSLQCNLPRHHPVAVVRRRVVANAENWQVAQDASQDFIDRQPIGRLGTAQEIANWRGSGLRQFELLSPANRICVDGGMTTVRRRRRAAVECSVAFASIRHDQVRLSDRKSLAGQSYDDMTTKMASLRREKNPARGDAQ